MKLKVLIIIYIFQFTENNLIAQIAFQRNIYKDDYIHKIDSLNKIHGNLKILPEEFKLQCLLALSQFPELDCIKIVFRHKKIKSTMACRPKFSFFFVERKKRTYIITINTKTSYGMLLKDVPFNAQVGVIAHEFGHIIDYIKKNSYQLVRTGIKYVNRKFKNKLEHETDSITIARGFGWQLYDFTNTILNSPKVSKNYKKFKLSYYMSLKEIKHKICSMEKYKNDTIN